MNLKIQPGHGQSSCPKTHFASSFSTAFKPSAFGSLLSLLLVFLLGNSSLAQRNVFHFTTPIKTTEGYYPLTFVYEVPTDSVRRIVYNGAPIDPRTAWLQKPAFVIPTGTIDSLKGAAALKPGYYLVVSVFQNQIYRSIIHKASFNVNIEDLERVKVLTITDDESNVLKSVNVRQAKKPILYEEGMNGYVLKGFRNADTIEVRLGNDVQYFLASVYNKQHEGPKRRNRTEEQNKESRVYNGYLVTNKPKYLPHDTVKWKAYIQNPYDKNRPVREHLRVSFEQQYNYGNGKSYIINPKASYQEPGVFFGEFVLGDSVETDRLYELKLYGTHSAFRINQSFKVEDYLLDELKLRVTGEDKKTYQPGDSVNLYAYAYNSNNLPVMDGNIKISVLTNEYSVAVISAKFIPDTLYSNTVPVSPDGETNIGFSTKGFPNELKSLQCLITLTNSNFEHKDTLININYSSEIGYLSVVQQGNVVHASVISNKQSVPGKGWLTPRKDVGYRAPIAISYPYEYTIKPNDAQLRFELTDDAGKVQASYTHSVADAMITGIEDFRGDTAFLQLSNPSKVLYRFSVFRGNDFEGFGFANGDTLLKVYSPRAKTVTIMGSYSWQGSAKARQFTIFKMDKDLDIVLTKRDLIYPGQRDTIGVRLTSKDGRPIPATNVTVFAFNSQFAEDFVPELPSAGLLYPAYTPKTIHAIAALRPVNCGTVMADRLWLARCGADTDFFYKNLYLLPDDIAWVNTEIPTSILPQLGIHLQKGRIYYTPEMVYIDGAPAYIRRINSSDPNGLFIEEGIHHISIRMANMEYVLHDIPICKGIKTDLYLNVDSVGPFYWKDTVRDSIITYRRTNHLSSFITKSEAPDSLTYAEKNAVASCTFIYRRNSSQRDFYNERQQATVPQFFQYPAYYQARNPYYRNDGYRQDANPIALVGPINFNDSVGFFQDQNTKLRFLPERGFVFTFRPQMTRVEKQSVYDYLGYKLSNIATWPQGTYVHPNPPLYDTQRVDWQASRDPAYFPSTQQALPVASRVRYSFTTSSYEQLNRRDASAKVRVVSLDTGIAYVVLQHLSDTTANYVVSGAMVVRIKAGTYKMMVIFSDRHYAVFEGMKMADNGTTILPVSYVQQRGSFDYSKPPMWLRPSMMSDTLYGDRYIFYEPRAAKLGTEGIEGMLRAQDGGPIAGATVEARLLNKTIRQTVTDKKGYYFLGPLLPDTYALQVTSDERQQTISGVPVRAGEITTIKKAAYEYPTGIIVTSKAYQRPLIDYKAPPHGMRTVEELERSPSVNVLDMAALSTRAYQRKNGSSMSIGGGRNTDATIIVDGVYLAEGNSSFQNVDEGDEPAVKGGKYYLRTPKSQQFLNNFMANMMGGSGMRQRFRDWAIWEPNLWTNHDGNTSFQVTYPDHITSWKTYVLAMNQDRYAGKIMELTRAFKPLSAQLSAPRFLRYGDTLEALGKVANYTPQAFELRSSAQQNGSVLFEDTMSVRNTKVNVIPVAAPANNSIDTASMVLSYKITAENGYMDGEEKTIPVFPIGVTESKGLFALLNGDTVITSKPDSAAGHFTGRSRIYVDGSLLEAMLRDIEKLKVYPHGCNEQLTTMLLSIYYEETIKRLLGNEKFNNTKAKRKILEQLIKAQQRDGGYGWWGNNNVDYRVTNYIISTMQKINKDGWLDVIISRGLNNLSSNLVAMSTENKIASLSTLSEGKYAANFKPVLDEIVPEKQTIYNRLAMVKIRKEQGLPYRAELDTIMSLKRETMNGTYWGNSYSYDWYRDDLAATLMAYKIVKGDSVYDYLSSSILRYVLFKRQYGYYSNTASNGLVLSTLLPDLIAQKPQTTAKSTYLKMGGSLKDSITHFPKMYAVNNSQQQFTFEKRGISPVYVSVVYDYFNINPIKKDADFTVKTYFLNSQNDTLTSLKAGERITLRTTVRCSKEAEYVMIEVPIPAGCVQAANNTRYPNYQEAARENFKDQTDIFCNRMAPSTMYTFDVVLEARYKGNFNIGPAKAGMMYFPEEYGNTAATKVRIK